MFVVAIFALCCVAAQSTQVSLGGQYAVVTTVQLGENAVSDAALQLHSTLDVTVLAAEEKNLLLNFELSNVEAHGRGAGRGADFTRRSSQRGGRFAARLRGSELTDLLLDPSEPLHLLNYKRALVSLFQFQMAAGERNETDASGACAVLYEPVADRVLRKIKRHCLWEGSASPVDCRRVTRITLSPEGLLDDVHADEVCGAGAGAGRARSLLALRRVASPPPRAARLPSELEPAGLPLVKPEDEDDEEHDSSLSEVADRWVAALPDEDAELSLALYRALRRASAEDIGDMLSREASASHDAALWRLAGAAGSWATHEAARGALRGDRSPALALPYLQGLALAPRPEEKVVLDVLSLSKSLPAPLATAARLAAAAAGARLSARAAVYSAISQALDACADDGCRADALLALGNLRGEAGAGRLLAIAQTSDERAALFALKLLRGDQLDRKTRYGLSCVVGTASRPLTVRGAALQLCVAAAAARPVHYLELARLLRSLESPELRRVFWGLLAELGLDVKLRDMLPGDLKTWDKLANAGTSSVLSRVAWAGLPGGTAARLLSAQRAVGGVLRAGAVSLLGQLAGRDHDVMGVEVWTRGLHTWAGGSGGGETLPADEEAAAGIDLSVAGVALPPITLFTSQAELLSLVWGGAGSEPTPILRATVLLPRGETRHAPLLAGVWLRRHEEHAAALKLDGQATVSLWSRTSSALLSLRASLFTRSTLSMRDAWARLSAITAARAAPELSIAADLDFYGDVALCVRAATHAHAQAANLTTVASVGRSTRKTVVRSVLREGRTLALGRPNDQICRR